MHIDLEDAIGLLWRDVEQRLHLGDARVVHHDVESAKRFLCVLDGSVDIVAAGDVSFERCSLAAQLADLVRYGVHLGLVHVNDGDVGTIARQPQRDRAADSLSCTRNERDFSFNRHGASPS